MRRVGVAFQGGQGICCYLDKGRGCAEAGGCSCRILRCIEWLPVFPVFDVPEHLSNLDVDLSRERQAEDPDRM